MTLDAVTTTPHHPAHTDTHGKPVTVTTPPPSPSKDVKPSEPPPSAASALDTFKALAADGDPANLQFLQQLTGAKSEDEMMQIINSNPLAFLNAVFAWAKANGIKGKSTDQQISMFLGRLRSDMGFGTSTSGVTPNHQILLVGGDNRINALVSVVGQLIYERYGEEAFQKYKARIEADWGADGKLSDDTLVMIDDAISTAEANYKPQYDASGHLLNPPPEVRIARMFIELGQKHGGADPSRTYNDIEAQVLFQTGKDITPGSQGSAKTPMTNLLAAVQKWLSLDKARDDNQRKYDAGKITKDQYLKTESFLSVQIKDARAKIGTAAKAAGVDPTPLLQKGTAQGFVLALVDPAAATRIDDLSKARAARKGEIDHLLDSGWPPGHPRVVKLIAQLKDLDAKIAAEADKLKQRGVDVSGSPTAKPGTGVADLAAGVEFARTGGLDRAYDTETKASTTPPPLTWTAIFAKVDQLKAKRAELAQVDADEKAGRLTHGLADSMRAKIKAEIGGLETELTGIAKDNQLSADTFTNPVKETGFRSAMVNPELGLLFSKRKSDKAELAVVKALIAKKEKAGVSADDPRLKEARERAESLRDEINKTEHRIHDIMYGVDPATSPEAFTAKEAEMAAAHQKYLDLMDQGADPAEIAAAKADWDKTFEEYKALLDRAEGPVKWDIDIDAYTDGALGAVRSDANLGWRYETDPGYRAGYVAADGLTKEQLAAALSFGQALDAALADGVITPEERAALVKQYREVAAFLPPGFLGTEDTSKLADTDPAWDAILTRSKGTIAGFADGAAQRSKEITHENQDLVLAADAPTVVAKLIAAADGKLKGESATAVTQYVLQMLGISLAPEELDAFLKGEPLPPSKQKAMVIAAQVFAQSQGQKVDDATAGNMLRNALSGDMGRATSNPGVDKWEEYTFAGTDNPETGPATPQTELLRSVLSVLHEIYAEVFGDKAAAELDKSVPPRLYDGAIIPVNKGTVLDAGGTITELDHYELRKDQYDPETGEVTGFKDKPWVNSEWSFEVVLTKPDQRPGYGGMTPVTKTERVNPNDKEKIAKLKAEGYTVARVEAKPAPEPQRMLGRLIEALFSYMKAYTPKYDKAGNLLNPPPLARIAQYYVQTQFNADQEDEGGRFKNYRIDKTGIVMTDEEAIRFMFDDLGIPPGDVDALLGAGGQQLGASSHLFDPQSKSDKIILTIADAFTGGLIGFLDGLLDKTSTDPLTDFGNDKLKDKGRDKWRSDHRDKMDDPSAFDLAFNMLLNVVPAFMGGMAFKAGSSGSRLAKRGADIADEVTGPTRAATGGLWDMPAEGKPSLRYLLEPPTTKGGKHTDLFTQIYGREPQDFSIGVHMMGETDHVPGPLPGGAPHGPEAPAAAPEIQPVAAQNPAHPPAAPGGIAPAMADGSPIPDTPNIYKWDEGVTFEVPPAGNAVSLPNAEGICTGVDSAGKPANYARVIGPDGQVVLVRVDFKTIPATATTPARREWHIYNPSEGASSVDTMPRLNHTGSDHNWLMDDTTPVSVGRYNKLIDDGHYISSGRHKSTDPNEPGVLPGLATNDEVAAIRGGQPSNRLSDPPMFQSTDPLDLLQPNGRNFLARNPARKKAFVDEFNTLKGRNSKLQLTLHAAKEDKAFWDNALTRLGEFQRQFKLTHNGREPTWSDLVAADPSFANSLVRKGLTKATFDQITPDMTINDVVGRVEQQVHAADNRVNAAQGQVNENANKLDTLVTGIDSEGNGVQTRSKIFTARNGLITTAIGLVAVGTGATGAVITKAINKKPDPAKAIDVEEPVTMAPQSEQTVDAAALAGTKGKGYTYEIPADAVRGKGANVDPKTGVVTISTRGDSVFAPGEKVTISVMIKDSKGNIKGKVTITVQVVKPSARPVVAAKAGDLKLVGNEGSMDLAKSVGSPKPGTYTYTLQPLNATGVSVDASTGKLTVAKANTLQPGSTTVSIDVKDAKGNLDYVITATITK